MQWNPKQSWILDSDSLLVELELQTPIGKLNSGFL